MKNYYVYRLIDPRDKKVFYVGKGKANRAYQHEKQVSRNPVKYSRSKKGEIIKSILESGLRVEIEFVDKDLEEIEALIIEEMEIQSIGLDNLTNVRSRGAVSAKERKPGFSDGMILVSSWMKIADARLSPIYGQALNDVHNELEEVMLMALSSSKSKMFVNGMSKAIDMGYSGFGCIIDQRKANWRPERLT